MMKSSVPLALLTLALTACGGEPSSEITTSDRPAAVTRSKPNEGSRALQAELERHFFKCGTIWRAKEGKGPNTNYHEYANLSFSVEEQTLTGADKLNGITFLGLIEFGDEMAYRMSGANEMAKWFAMEASDYVNYNGERYEIRRVNGAWDFSKAFPRPKYFSRYLDLEGLEKIDCEEHSKE